MTQRIISVCFYILFFFTPLFFTSVNHELFEYNKMMLVYGLAIIITGCWIFRMIQHQKHLFKRSPLDIPILLFLLSQFLSTIFSIDPHTSWWGYYSRSNGGLYSIISYVALYFAFISQVQKSQIHKYLIALLLGGLLVSLYAIPEHFGVSPSCIILNNSFSADCWIQDVQARVFATLGQPNWLAAYLAILIFPALYFYLTTKKLWVLIASCLFFITFYLAFTFTFSRGATLGFLAGLAIFLLWTIRFWFWDKPKDEFHRHKTFVTKLIVLLAIFIGINIYFGSSLTQFKLEKQTIATRPSILPGAPTPGGTQLENGGTESGQIRLIVWKGALEVFKAYPILGSGVETFAYSYYNFRPIEHNYVSEWDFLYNKAHNEYLNYLATTGIVGILSYLTIIFSFIFWCISYYLKSSKSKTHNLNSTLLTIALIASYISYLIQNAFGFSVVFIALLFYLLPAFVFVYTDNTKEIVDLKYLPGFIKSLFSSIYKRNFYVTSIKALLAFTIFFLLLTLYRYWYADTLFNKASNYSDMGNAGQAYNYFLPTVAINKGEPLYKSELGSAAASAALALQEEEPTRSAELKDEAIFETEQALSISPYNVSFLRTAIKTYYELTLLDPTLESTLMSTIDRSIELAPTDPKLFYNKALIQSHLGKNDEAIKTMQEAIRLRPQYREAYFTLGTFYEEQNKNKEAIEQFNQVLKLVPGDADALKKIQEISTKSAEPKESN